MTDVDRVVVPRTYTVYKGERNGKLVYIGTTIQEPSARFRWHKANGKDLKFTVLEQYDNAGSMLDEEHRLIKRHSPKLNKIRHRRQNLNVALTQAELEARKGVAEWCQSCLRRRVSKGYSRCMRCCKH